MNLIWRWGLVIDHIVSRGRLNVMLRSHWGMAGKLLKPQLTTEQLHTCAFATSFVNVYSITRYVGDMCHTYALISSQTSHTLSTYYKLQSGPINPPALAAIKFIRVTFIS